MQFVQGHWKWNEQGLVGLKFNSKWDYRNFVTSYWHKVKRRCNGKMTINITRGTSTGPPLYCLANFVVMLTYHLVILAFE